MKTGKVVLYSCIFPLVLFLASPGFPTGRGEKPQTGKRPSGWLSGKAGRYELIKAIYPTMTFLAYHGFENRMKSIEEHEDQLKRVNSLSQTSIFSSDLHEALKKAAAKSPEDLAEWPLKPIFKLLPTAIWSIDTLHKIAEPIRQSGSQNDREMVDTVMEIYTAVFGKGLVALLDGSISSRAARKGYLELAGRICIKFRQNDGIKAYENLRDIIQANVDADILVFRSDLRLKRASSLDRLFLEARKTDLLIEAAALDLQDGRKPEIPESTGVVYLAHQWFEQKTYVLCRFNGSTRLYIVEADLVGRIGGQSAINELDAVTIRIVREKSLAHFGLRVLHVASYAKGSAGTIIRCGDQDAVISPDELSEFVEKSGVSAVFDSILSGGGYAGRQRLILIA